MLDRPGHLPSTFRFTLTLVAVGALSTAGLASAEVPEAAPPPTEAAATAPAAAPDAPSPAAAAPAEKRPSWTDRVTVGGRLWLSWMADLSEGKDALNAFDVGRAYLQVKAKLSDHFRVALTLDAPRRVETIRGASANDGAISLTRSSGAYDTVVKHAFGEVVDMGTKGLWLRFGMQGLPWVPYEEGQWTYRYQGAVLADREGYWSSTDLGLTLGYDFPDKHFSILVMVANGETWSSPEATKHKDVHTRLTLRPFAGNDVLAGLELSGAASLGTWGDGDEQARQRFLAQLAFRRPLGALAFTFLATSDPAARLASRQPSLASSPGVRASGSGLSAWGWLDLGLASDDLAGLRLMGRFDLWDPDTDLDDNGHTRQILGLSYRFNKHVEALLNVELVQWDDAAGPTQDETLLYATSDWTF